MPRTLSLGSLYGSPHHQGVSLPPQHKRLLIWRVGYVLPSPAPMRTHLLNEHSRVREKSQKRPESQAEPAVMGESQREVRSLVSRGEILHRTSSISNFPPWPVKDCRGQKQGCRKGMGRREVAKSWEQTSIPSGSSSRLPFGGRYSFAQGQILWAQRVILSTRYLALCCAFIGACLCVCVCATYSGITPGGAQGII